MEKIKLVSCIIPSYKRTNTLKRAINSVLAQTYKTIEVLVVDDNITGDEYSVKIRQIVDGYHYDSRVRLITQPKHINGAEARNAGILAAKGEWIAFLDDDDEWLPTKIEKQIKALNIHPECMGVSCLYNEYMDNVLKHSCPCYTTENLTLKIFTRQIAVFTSTVLLNREKLLEFGGFNNKLKRHQDLQLLIDFSSRNNMTVVPEYLVKLHADSNINRPTLNTFIKIKEDFFRAMSDLFKSYSKVQQNLILSAHYYEIVFVALKEKNFYIAMKYIFKAGIHPKAISMLMQRIKDKKYINCETI